MTIEKPAVGRSGWNTTFDAVIDEVNALAAGRSGDRAYAVAQDAAHVAAVDPHADRAYTDTQIATLTTTVSGKLVKASNLSDLTSASTARTNLSLGSVDNTADTAKPVSTAQQTALDAKLTAASNLSDLTSATSARTNLGLAGAATLAVGTSTGTVAAGDDSRITGAAQKASNLSDVASASTARTNLAVPADSAVVHNTGNETIAGVKTFGSAPVVPSASFPEAAVSGLVTDLAAKLPLTHASPAPQRHGATGDGATDDTAALQAWLAAGYTTGYVPPGTYLTTATLSQPATMKVTFAPGATIKASATIAGPIWETPVGTAVNQGFLSGATFDCNGNAQNGVYLRYVQHFALSDVTVLTPTSHGVVLGDPAAAATSYECMVHNLSVWRASSSSVPSGSYGLWLRNASDCEVVQATIVGAETGVRNDTGDNRFANVHVWGYSSHNPVTGFDDNANATTWVGCIADTPTTYGFRLRQFNTVLVGCKVYVGTFGGVDNVVIGVQADQTTPFFTAVGCIFQGNDSSHRLARDFGGTLTSSQTIGTQTSNTVATATTNTASAVKVIGVSSAAFNVTGSSQWVNINSNFTGHALEVVNGTPMKGYSGNFTNQTLELISTTGGVRSGSTAGLGATVFSGSGAPTIAGTAGDRYLRTDTPSTSNQREYICTVTGIAGAATWVGIL